MPSLLDKMPAAQQKRAIEFGKAAREHQTAVEEVVEVAKRAAGVRRAANYVLLAIEMEALDDALKVLYSKERVLRGLGKK